MFIIISCFLDFSSDFWLFYEFSKINPCAFWLFLEIYLSIYYSNIVINVIIFINRTNIVAIATNGIKQRNNLFKPSNLLYIFINKLINKYSNQTIGISKIPPISMPHLKNPTIAKPAFSYGFWLETISDHVDCIFIYKHNLSYIWHVIRYIFLYLLEIITLQLKKIYIKTKITLYRFDIK